MKFRRLEIIRQISFGQWFGVLAGLAAVLLIAASATLYAVAVESARAASTHSARFAAETVARSLEQLAVLLNGSMDKLAQDPGPAQALQKGTPVAIQGEEERLTRLMPGALLVRLLPEAMLDPDLIINLDEQRSPKMGFADLDLVRQTRNGVPQPAIHAANSPEAHLALVRRLAAGGGVILASLNPKLVDAAIAASMKQGALELKQQSLSLVFRGDTSVRGRPPAGTVPVLGTPWNVAYWDAAVGESTGRWFLAVPGIGVALMAGLAYLVYRWSLGWLRQDQDNIVQAARDIFTGRTLRNYRIRIDEMKRFLTQLEQMKRMSFDLSPRQEPAEPVPRESQPAEPIAALRPREPGSPPVSPAPDMSPTLFRAYDIRGVVGETLTADIVQWIGRAIGSEARERGDESVAIGRDGRLSSPDLAKALSRGLMDAGCTVYDLGMVPTPVLYYATQVLDTGSGVMVTGSHNPASYNGLKIVVADAPLAEEDLRQLHARIREGRFASGRGQVEFRTVVPDYIERIAQDMQVARPMKVVVDCGNGAAGAIAPRVLEEIGCEVVPLYCEVDGNFPNHHPDPSRPENLQALIKAVAEVGADLGIALDGDGDRLGVVDSAGKIIWPDRQLMVFAADVLSREPGSDIIFDVKCTRHLAGYVVKHGGRPLMWKTGHSLIKAKMRETGAALAGELSGHIYFRERWFGFDDGIYASARLVEILSGDDRPTAAVFAELPDSVSTPELNIPLKEGESLRFITRLREQAEFSEARVTDIDGLRVDFADGWGLVRASNTIPALVVRFEADTPEAMAGIQARFKALMLAVKPDLALPF
jgi:phosphomannomutase/phosphoglucomutase